jgi:hypothetical protein
VNDQSVTGVVTGFPLSQSPGRLQDKDLLNGPQSLGSKPKMRAENSSKIRQINIDPPILHRIFNGSPPPAGKFVSSIPAKSFPSGISPDFSEDTPNRFHRATLAMVTAGGEC